MLAMAVTGPSERSYDRHGRGVRRGRGPDRRRRVLAQRRLVVRGEPGVGKSALLGHAIERATGMRVLRASGIDAESELAFAALHRLVRPILDLRARLAEPQAAALAGAL